MKEQQHRQQWDGPEPGTPSSIPERPLLTCRVDVEVGGFVGQVAGGLQARTPGLDPGRVAQGLGHVDHEGTLVDVLAGKQHLDLRVAEEGQSSHPTYQSRASRQRKERSKVITLWRPSTLGRYTTEYLLFTSLTGVTRACRQARTVRSSAALPLTGGQVTMCVCVCVHLLCVSLWILHVHQDFTQTRLHCLHQEGGRLQNHVPQRLHA